jgi:putative hydroxymethylpyrimidine transport system substrate-binding protein
MIGISIVLIVGCGDSGSRQVNAAEAAEAKAAKAAQACLRRSANPPAAKGKLTPGGKGLKNLHLTLKGYPDAEDAGILIAAERGYFADAGLNLEITSPVITSNLPEYLVQGASDLGILPQPQVTIARAEGMPLVAFGSVIRQPTMAMMSLRSSRIEDAADLEGKTVAINSLPFEEVALEAILGQAGLTLDDVKLKQASYGLVQALLDKRADAILGASPNLEGVELEACGLKPIMVPLQKLGVPPYEELVLVARRDRLARQPELFRAFTSALARGTAAAAADPRATAEAISLYRVEMERGTPQKPALVEAKVKATLPLLSRSGSTDPARAAHFAAWMHDEGLIQGR